ncbi:MAG: HAMP domain-containing protein, partial [Gemmatimonadales bacterium]
HYVLLAALGQRRTLSVVVGPRTRLILPTRIARILRPAVDAPPLYNISLSPPQPYPDSGVAPAGWKRERGALLTDVEVSFADGNRHVHVAIPPRGNWMMVAYGLLAVAMVQLVVLGVLGLAFLSSADWGGPGLRRSVRSFRFRPTITLAMFFIIPMLGFTVWGLSRADQENQRARDAAVSAVLHNAVLSAGGMLREPPADMTDDLSALAARLESDLFLYRGGRLAAASQPLLAELGLVEPLQDAASFQRLSLGDELELTRQGTAYVTPIRVGYRVVLAGPPQSVGVLATPQLASNWQRQQIQRDLSVLLLLAVVVGVGAALLGAQLAARGLSRPVADLERSAMAVGAGRPLPAPLAPPLEFERVFAAFSEMAADIRASQVALESARQRTAAVLAQVATGVVALEPGGRILLANQRAREVLGASLVEGENLRAVLPRDGGSIAEVVALFEQSGAQSNAREVEQGGRVLRLQLARLAGEPGGVVLAIDDLTDVTRAARVLAWGEMAQQVAHEIKNPLTPIRLGVQHLRRVERERPDALPGALEEITTRILAEIERLDTIARAFSRFAAPGDENTLLEPVDVAELTREVTALYRLGGDDFTVELSGAELVRPSRPDELREVLGNLIENARNAGARRLQIAVGNGAVRLVDDGKGIPGELLDRVFEPRFSTNTSGAGLGLAIVRRLVEGWGARIEIQSAPGRGTSVTIRWPA